MPANLPPQYFEVEKRCREARSVSDKLKHLEEMLAIMPKHQGTDKLKADLLPNPYDLELYLEVLGERFQVLVASAYTGRGFPELGATLFALLNLVRVYTRVPGQAANFKSPFVLPARSTIQELADRLHNELGNNFKFARVGGKDTFEGQRVQRDYLLREGDIVEIHT